MRHNLAAMNSRIPNDVGQVVKKVYDKMELDERQRVKELPLEENTGWYEPLKQQAMAYHSLDENVAEKRVKNDTIDAFQNYMGNGYDINEQTAIYLSIVSTAQQYRAPEEKAGQTRLDL